MKTSELEGAKLDYWVARAAQIEEHDGRLDIPVHLADCTGQSKYFSFEREQWRPSALWQHGGPIIDREGISIVRDPWSAENPDMGWDAYCGDLDAARFDNDRADGFGPTPLIAAMRAFVASKLGEEVPDA